MAYHQRTIINYHYLADWCMTWILFCCLVAKSWTILCSPMDCSPSGSSVHGILQPMDCSQQEFFSKQEYQSGLPFPSPGYLPNPGIKPRSPALQVDSLPAEPQGKPKNTRVVAYPFSGGSSQPRNQTRVPCIAGGYQLSYQGSPLLQ